MLAVAAGDTGASAAHAEIGRRMPPPDLSAIPIGAYAPRNIMKEQHCDPEEAVQIHKVPAEPLLLFTALAGQDGSNGASLSALMLGALPISAWAGAGGM